MPTRNISLTEHFDRFVKESVTSGRYLNASEVVREGLRLLEQKSREETLKIECLQQAAEAGFEAVDWDTVPALRDDDLRETISTLGRRAARRARGGAT